LTSSDWKAGGAVESTIRIFTHMNVQESMDQTVVSQAATLVDYVGLGLVWLAKYLIPNFEYFSRATQYAPNGFDLDWNSGLLPTICVTVAYAIPCLILGFYSLRLRELESK